MVEGAAKGVSEPNADPPPPNHTRRTMTKYKARRTECNQGHTHDSAKEAKRCNELHLLQRAGQISGLETQRPYDIAVNGKKICRYVADFTYTERGAFVAEDTKGFRTPEYKLKSKLMSAVFGIDVRET